MTEEKRNLYQIVSDFLTPSIDFYNHGYAPSYPEYSSDIMKNQLSLYRYALEGVETRGKKILDVGCGRGGFSRVYREMGFSEIHGCDILEENISFAKKHYDGVEFSVCDAMDLNVYSENYFDIVTNVESSHCYKDRELFHSEVKRILKPEGIFVYVDINPEIEDFGEIIEEDITENVENSVRENLETFKNIEDEQSREIFLKVTENALKNYEGNAFTCLKFICRGFK